VLSSVLRLQYVEHRDVAFDLLRLVPERPRAIGLMVLGAIAIVALATLLIRGGGSPVRRAGFLLTLAGALGNYTDRLIRGFVVDFIRLPHWPVFNVADMLVVMGVALLFWDQALRSRPTPTPA
jgi:signal peptidase II